MILRAEKTQALGFFGYPLKVALSAMPDLCFVVTMIKDLQIGGQDFHRHQAPATVVVFDWAGARLRVGRFFSAVLVVGVTLDRIAETRAALLGARAS